VFPSGLISLTGSNLEFRIVGSPELLKYLQDVVAEHGFEKYMKFSHQVVGASWSEEDAKWYVEISQETPEGTKTFTNVCDILISGTGILNVWKYPNVEGLKDYKGKLLHTANWDATWNWEGKTIACLGSGASAIQVVPQLQKGKCNSEYFQHCQSSKLT
jgi:cation diffusion facilitator CzcD-associated flavoprotein CzcO